MDSRNEGLGPAGQRFVQGPSTSSNSKSGLPEIAGLSALSPVLNFSIQTGEEFALEFMRERVTSKKTSGSNASADQGYNTNYMDLRGVLGISHTGSESGSEMSMLAAGDKSHYKDIEKRGLTESDSRNQRYASSRSIPRVPSGEGSSRGGVSRCYSSGTSDTTSKKMKILCSYGGKILPRPSDGKLRYVGGDTRIIRISKDISWQELLQKTTSIYNQAHTVKYQLPGEDLDALVSVSCDEDLQNMMEECSVLDVGEASQKLRMFLFLNDYDDLHFSLGSIEGDSEIQYVVAVNGMDVGVGKTSSDHGMASTSASDLDQLVNLNIEVDRAKTSRVPSETVGIPSGHLASNLATPTSSAFPQSLSSDYGTHVHSYDNSRMQYVEGEHYLYTASQASDSFHNMNSRISMPAAIPSDYNYNSLYSPVVETSTSTTPHYPPTHIQLGSEGQNNVPRTAAPTVPATDKKLPVDVLAREKNENDHFLSRENENAAPINQEVSLVPPIPEHVSSLFSLKHNGNMPEAAVVLSTADATVSSGLASHLNEDDRYASGGAVASECSDYDTDIADLSYNDPPRPPRFFHSERIPREQAEFLNRLSKSDDSIGAQFLNLQPRSGVAEESIAEAADSSLEGNTISQTERLSAAKPPKPNTTTLEDGLVQFEKYKELADAIKKTNKDGVEEASDNSVAYAQYEQKSELNRNDQVIDNDNRERSEPVAGGNLEKYIDTGETGPKKGGYKEMPIDGVKVVASTTTLMNNPTSILPEFPWEGTPISAAFSTNVSEHMGAFRWAEASSVGAVLQGESSYPPAEQRDIAIDINDHFPSNLLADIFSNAGISDDSAVIRPLRKDDAGISLNMPKHEPQRWSFFRNLAQGEFARKDVSLIDQDHIGYSPPLVKVDNRDQRAYKFSPLDGAAVGLSHMDSQVEFDEEMQQESSSNIEDDANAMHQDYISSQVSQPHLMDKVGESFQVENPYVKVGENLTTTTTEFEELKFAIAETCGQAFDTDIDFNNLQIIKNEDLEELRELGSGTFGTVYHGKWRGTDVAIKRIKKSCFTGRSSEQERLTQEFWREAEILSKLHHPNVVAFYGVVQDGPGGTLATVTEFMVNGSLRHVLLRKDKYLDRRKRLIIAMDAAFGMEYLHSKNIVHFDLKCDNLLVNLKDQSRPICKVGDFGLSKIKRNTLVSGGVRGTLPWMAPELLNGSSNKVSEKVDVFSFGIVLWEILTGDEPYANMHYGAIIGGIVNNTLRPPIPVSCDPEWRRLMELCWAPDPQQRPSFTQIANRLRAMSQSKPAK
ncbi:hypothetical protein IEQ34_015663 [Dendrobium chrysotoxum]|uniref:Protein kinase domain-containing protein n=1 Tax=Dendrobium chrysotoxum TaxID=161865 RepID=A0AAV7GHR7_DENCH|nr:hypothetical protein IEQ34_015663 [Dendrobium chrysotoxum]